MKTIIKIFICISLIYTPFFAFAGAAEKWEIVENVYDQSKNTVNVTAKKISQQAANSGVYKVQVPVSPSDLGSTVKRMLWVGVASAAVTALIEGVGWIIDEGSQVIKKPSTPIDPTINENYSYACITGGVSQSLYDCARAYAAANSLTFDSCPAFNPTSAYQYPSCIFKYPNGNKTGFVPAWTVYDPKVIPAPSPDIIISDSQLGNEILGNGTEPNSSSQPAPDIIADAYNPNNPVSDASAPKQTNKALDSANPQPQPTPTNPDPDADTGSATPKPNVDTDGDGQPDEYSPSQPSAGTQFTLPNFCGWAPAVCDWFTWTKQNDDLPQDEKPEISQIPTPELKEDAVRWSAQCPADAQVPINMQGVSSTITFSWSPWCQLLSMIKPAIVVSAYIGAAFIVLGLRT